MTCPANHTVRIRPNSPNPIISRLLDYETKNSYTITVEVRDSKDPEGEPDRRRPTTPTQPTRRTR